MDEHATYLSAFLREMLSLIGRNAGHQPLSADIAGDIIRGAVTFVLKTRLSDVNEPRQERYQKARHIYSTRLNKAKVRRRSRIPVRNKRTYNRLATRQKVTERQLRTPQR